LAFICSWLFASMDFSISITCCDSIMLLYNTRCGRKSNNSS
jgi:hypothetical protein